jgi:hypothetical protein
MLSTLYLDNNSVKQNVDKTSSNQDTSTSTHTCELMKLQVFERLYTKVDRVTYVDDKAELIDGNQNYVTTSPFWVNNEGIANLVKFDSMFVSDNSNMAKQLNKVLNKVVPLWRYSTRRIIANGTFYDYKWIYNKTQQLLMVELTNGVVQYYKSTLNELFASVNLDRYEDGYHYVDDFDIKMKPDDELYVYRDYGVLMLVFIIVREHKPLRPIEYVNAAFCPRPASVCLFANDSVATTTAKK